jgi:hypothetical protein
MPVSLHRTHLFLLLIFAIISLTSLMYALQSNFRWHPLAFMYRILPKMGLSDQPCVQPGTLPMKPALFALILPSVASSQWLPHHRNRTLSMDSPAAFTKNQLIGAVCQEL